MSRVLVSKSYWLLAIWLIALLTSLVLLQRDSLKTFDPNGRLAQLIAPSDAIDVELTALSRTRAVLLDITQSSCPCRWLSSPHRNSVRLLAQEQGLKVLSLDFQDLDPAIAAAIPSTPAVLIAEQGGQLRYAGPYAAGAFCSPGQGLVEPWITQNQWRPELGPALLSDAEGCYCATKA